VQTSVVISYPAMMMNLIWFANEKMFIVSALSNMRTWNQASHDLKMQPFCKLGVLVLEHVKVKLSPYTRRPKCDRFARFFVAATVKLKICHQRTRFFTIRAG